MSASGQGALLGGGDIGPIDGVDRSLSLMGEVIDSEVPGVKKRREDGILLEFDALGDSTVFRQGQSKLILGTPGRSHRFLEPRHRWYDASLRLRFIVEELVTDVFDRWMSSDYLLYGWATRALIDSAIAGFSTTAAAEGGMGSPRAPLTRDDITSQLLNATVEITPARLPLLQWPAEVGGRQFVRLFDLTSDPFEDNNLATAHNTLGTRTKEKEIEERAVAMAKKARQWAENGGGGGRGAPAFHHAALQRVIFNQVPGILRTIVLGFTAFVLTLGLIGWGLMYSGKHLLRQLSGGRKKKRKMKVR